MILRYQKLSLFIACILAGCATTPSPTLKTSPISEERYGNTLPAESDKNSDVSDRTAVPLIRRGTGVVINQHVAAAPPNLRAATTGSATFNFEGESVQTVIKAILGDLLGQNYVIAPGIQGTVTLATPRPVSPAQALSLLEMVLSWNNARMVYNNGRYNIVPADQAITGSLSPSTAPPSTARGYEVRVVALHYISANEMKKVLEPYARPNAIVAVDSTRNVITIAGTRGELENYMRTIEIFDVDWLSGMSVGVFPIDSGRADKVAADLEKVFGDASKTPSAGMFRFMPLDHANAILVITPQARYLDQIREWLERIDSATSGAQLFSYELKYIKAKDLADRLAEVFGSGQSAQSSASLAPGSQSNTIGSYDQNGANSLGQNNNDLGDSSSDSSGGGLGNGSMRLAQRTPGNGSVTLNVKGDKVGVSAVEETNTLLVHATPQAWRSIRDIVEKLDVMPMQVHIEAQVAEVSLSGQLQYGVNWFFENAINAPADSNAIGINGGANLPNNAARHAMRSFAGKINHTDGIGWTFLGRNAASVISALDSVTRLKLLQAPSVFVRNNAEAVLNVGTRIPINTSSVNTGGNNLSTYSSVQYLDTGVILRVRPRVTKDGMVFLDLVQEVSTPGPKPTACAADGANATACNVDINTRRIKTEAAVQSGDTILLAGLINDSTSQGSSGLPGLSRLPIIGALFGSKTQDKARNEVIVLITPTIVRNVTEARELTDEYSQRFEAMKPMKPLEHLR